MKQFSITYKIIIFFSVFILAVISIIVAYTFTKSKNIIEAQIVKDYRAIAEGVEGQLFIFFEKIKTQSADWASDGFIRQQTEELVRTGNYDSAEALKEHLLKNKMPIDPLVFVVDILNTDMKTIASSDAKRVGISEEEHAEGKSKEELMALKYGETIISQVMIEQESEIVGGLHPEYPVFHSLVPIKSADNKTTIGFLLLHFSADNLNKIVGGSFQVELGALSGQEFILNQKTSEMFLVNKDGFMITPSRFIEDSVLRQKIDNPATQACFNDKKEYEGIYIGYLGKEVHVASMCLVVYDVVLLVEIETNEILAPSIRQRNSSIVMGLMMWIFSIIATFFFVNLFLKRLKLITKSAGEVAKNNFDIRVDIKSQDEIGILAQAFNLMLDSIQREDKFILLLRDVATYANEAKTVNEVYQIVIDKICAYQRWPIGHVYIPSSDNPDMLVPTHIWNFSDQEKFQIVKEVTEKTNFPKGVGLPGRILESKSFAWIEDVSKDSNFPRGKLIRGAGIKAAFGFPVIIGDGKVVAVFEFFNTEAQEVDTELLGVVKNVGIQVARIIEKIGSREILEEKIRERTKELEDIKATLELRVHEKTMELEKRLKDLERFKSLTIGRELRMVELKDEIDKLKKELESKS